ncbi:reverse transcriptase [Plakobranchus ocellatus]|uniref:Reverse transcriptase n=1 Tax=Plakobranchus ocellatus TaxID=259542 RepID=A0AAV4AMM9_9GAST|nr:reverse transcriptase [Plakobranchus ocellatus]
MIHSASAQQIIMVEITVPYESRMEEAHAFKEGKYLDMTKELKKRMATKLRASSRPKWLNAGFVTRCTRVRIPGKHRRRKKKVGSREASESHDLDVARPP